MKIYLALVLGFLLLTLGCTSFNKKEDSIETTKSTTNTPQNNLSSVEFGIYLSETNELVLSDKDISLYLINSSTDGSIHQLKLAPSGVKKIKSYSPREPPLLGGLSQKSFIIKLNGKEKYRGAFWSYASSQTYYGIVIIDPLMVNDQSPYLFIYPNYPDHTDTTNDHIDNTEIKEFFKSKNKLIEYGSDTFSKDFWSFDCKNGTYAVYNSSNPHNNNEFHICASLALCKTDLDCKYLEIDSLPPRIGQCVNNQCKAICGSGRIWEC